MLYFSFARYVTTRAARLNFGVNSAADSSARAIVRAPSDIIGSHEPGLSVWFFPPLVNPFI